jgi:magnesium transporter
MITIVGFNFTTRQDRPVPIGEVAAAFERGDYCWIDIHCPDCGADCPTCKPFLEGLGINATCMAEILGPDNEGRYDVYEDCLHFAVSEATLRESRLATAHVDVVLASRFLLTYRRHDAEFPRQIRRTCREDFHKFAKSPGFLLYELGDHLIDVYRRTFRAFSGSVEEIQLRLFGDVDDGIFRQVAELTQDILTFRKIVLASRELMHELASRRSPYISDTTQPFLEKMAGTLERLGADVTTEREGLNESLNLYMGMVSHRTNKVVNRLTVISALFLPLTFLCGVYGMNFQVMPELGHPQGYLIFWCLVVAISASMLAYMKKRKWL